MVLGLNYQVALFDNGTYETICWTISHNSLLLRIGGMEVGFH
jgi:hypothetical protein